MTRVGVYARVSTADQRCEGQLEAQRRHAAARGWVGTEYVDRGVSGAREHRPALDAMLAAARRREIDVIVVTKLDRLARSLPQLVALGHELAALGVDLVVLDQAIDTTTPAGRAMYRMLAVFSEFERDLIRERVVAGVRRAQAHGTRSGKRIGRPARVVDAEEVRRRRDEGQTWRRIAKSLKIPARTLSRRAEARHNPQAGSAPGGPLPTGPAGASDGRGTT